MLRTSFIVVLCLFALTSFVSIAVANIFLGISLLLFLTIIYKDSGVYINSNRRTYFKVFGIFAAALFVSAVFSGNVLLGLKTWGDFFVWRFMPFIMIMSVIKSDKVVKKLMYAVICGFAFSCIYAIYQGVFIYGVNIASSRADGLVGHSMTLAGWACILLPVLLLFIFQKEVSKYIRLGCACLFVIGFIALIFNATRGAWLSLAIVLPMLTLPYILQNKKLFIAFVSLVMAAGVILFNSSSFMKRVDSIFDSNNWSNASRFVIWSTAHDIFLEHPIWGVGLGSFKQEYKSRFVISETTEQEAAEYFEYIKNKKQNELTATQNKLSELQLIKLADSNREKWQKEHLRKLDHAHNNFMQMLAENGFIGLLGYVFAFGYVLWSNFTKYRKNRNPYALMIVGATSALLFQGFTEYNFGNSSVMKIYWFVLACLIILANNYGCKEK